jgi:hypothetical protein
VVAFDRLAPSRQAQLFIDINAEQKSVKQSLLHELYAELHWNSDDPLVRVRAVVSKTIQSLNVDPQSPFYGRILASDDRRDAKRCISLQTMYKALPTDLFIAPTKRTGVNEHGPLWAGDDNDAMRRRAQLVINRWFTTIQNAVPDWWELGASEGGGLAMNDGVTACVNVLKSVMNHLEQSSVRLVTLDDEDLAERTEEYARALGLYFAGLTEEQRKSFRDFRGIQGQVTRTRLCQQAIHQQIESFDPPGLRDYMATAKVQTNRQAKEIIDRIESALLKLVVEDLKSEFDLDDNQWWVEGVPKTVRVRVANEHEQDDGARGGREHYFNLIDYRTIALSNWELFGPTLGFGKPSMSKDKRTSWMQELNESRKIVSHATSGKTVSLAQLGNLEEYERLLKERIEAR